MGLSYVLSGEDAYALPYTLESITLITVMLLSLICAVIFYTMLDSRIINKTKPGLTFFSDRRYFIFPNTYKVIKSEVLRIDATKANIFRTQDYHTALSR